MKSTDEKRAWEVLDLISGRGVATLRRCFILHGAAKCGISIMLDFWHGLEITVHEAELKRLSHRMYSVEFGYENSFRVISC